MSARRVRQLNDEFRRTLQGGKVVVTSGVEALGENALSIVLGEVQTFADFGAVSDPHSAHDFGTFDVAGHKFLWKIDAYDTHMEFGSEDPADSMRTTRVLTVMLASEY
jgi:hypothetical protein